MIDDYLLKLMKTEVYQGVDTLRNRGRCSTDR